MKSAKLIKNRPFQHPWQGRFSAFTFKLGFYNYTDQYSNWVLTAIGQQLGIESRIHWHVGRKTFGTEFTRRCGNITVLPKLMDHAKISTTMKYVHVDADMKRAAIALLDALNE